MNTETSTHAGEATRNANRRQQYRGLVGGAALVLSGLAVALGVSVAAAGEASATSCFTVASEIAFHNARGVDQTNEGAVAAYNREANILNGIARSCGYTLTD